MGIKVNGRKRNSSIFDEMVYQNKKYPNEKYCNVCWEINHSESECLRSILLSIAESLDTIAKVYVDANN